ncbi:hypothetical protein BLI708_02230 [Bifidobacterium imperatoris]|uniref:Uncharacterized protein n=1 Tax=Bifidobacterium imperatoris TaxID=2020965 RepID=A0A2N5ITL5_9BIFI|nr:hypothetical protein [Bifidobacterium imperatoris]PLS25281.1 hypothetical protein Tam1G_0691 [Bifidobacterium imperatoris]QSY58159.1 hypothetical protein BLI708_02230 [Bifidobacterium imperatoris]
MGDSEKRSRERAARSLRDKGLIELVVRCEKQPCRHGRRDVWRYFMHDPTAPRSQFTREEAEELNRDIEELTRG